MTPYLCFPVKNCIFQFTNQNSFKSFSLCTLLYLIQLPLISTKLSKLKFTLQIVIMNKNEVVLRVFFLLHLCLRIKNVNGNQHPNILLILTDDQDVVLGGLEPMVSVNLSVIYFIRNRAFVKLCILCSALGQSNKILTE